MKRTIVLGSGTNAVLFTCSLALANPAHSADRGPVSIFSARLHGEF
jgi:hypothetical protein